MANLKYNLLIIVFLTQLSLLGQVNFTKLPLNNQLVPRDISTNLGEIIIEGNVDSIFDFTAIKTIVLREGAGFDTVITEIDYSSGIGTFSNKTFIEAELANYSFRIYGITTSGSNLLRSITNIVAGDAFIIQGQSNGEAKLRLGSSSNSQRNFIRVYASGTRNPNILANNNKWYVGQGDTDHFSNGNTGQWGLRLAQLLVDSLKIPIAIFNGAHSAEQIAFFERPENLNSLNSNYERLNYRLESTGFSNHVRAVFFSQGESDANPTIATSTADYKNYLVSLFNDMKSDYTSLEKFYIFQTKNSCGFPVEYFQQIKEAQRQVAIEDTMVHIMVTAAIPNFSDLCHFEFENGYKVFADRIFPLVLRDIYNIENEDEIEPPMILDAILTNDTTLIIPTNAKSLSLDSSAEDFQIDNDSTVTINNIEVIGNRLVFSLSGYPDSSAAVSYSAQYQDPGNFVVNQNQLELVCFNKYPIRKCFSTMSYINYMSCESFTSPSGKYVWTSSGIYSDTISNYKGCDSIIIIDLKINYPTTSIIYVSACDFYLSPGGHSLWLSSGIYQDTIKNHIGCDSIITVNLLINKSSQSSLNIDTCNQYISPSGNYVWTNSGEFIDTISNYLGCDSIITVNLTINQIENTILQEGQELEALEIAEEYQWLDCNQNYAPIIGENNQNFHPLYNSQYAVLISKYGCIDTSSCYAYITVGFTENDFDDSIKILSNPMENIITVFFEKSFLSKDINIYNTQGQLVSTIQNNMDDKIVINTRDLNKGIYIMAISTQSEGSVFYKFAK